MLLNLALDPSATTSSGDSNANWQGLVPVPFAASEEHLHVLESLLKFIEALFHYSNEATAVRPNGRTAAEWQELLLAMRSDFFLPDKNSAADYAALGQAQELPIPYPVVRALLSATLERPAPGEAFLNGKITFCSLLPMRGIPCKVIALLGMDEAKFPRQDEKLGFNLMRNANLISGYSHSRSMEDRYTFLEAILAARDYLMVFYHGRDDKSLDNLLPAAPVAELLDYAARLRKLSTDGDSNKNLIVIEHRLNAFDAKNFRPQGIQSSAGWLRSTFSYDSTNAAIIMQPQAAIQPSPLTDLGQGLFQLPLPSNKRGHRHAAAGRRSALPADGSRQRPFPASVALSTAVPDDRRRIAYPSGRSYLFLQKSTPTFSYRPSRLFKISMGNVRFF